MLEFDLPRDEVESIVEGRYRVNRDTGVEDKRVAGEHESLETDRIGAIAEGAVAMWCGRFDEWLSNAVKDVPQSQAPDVGRFHVRGCRRGRGLLVKPKDVDGPYVLAWSDTVVFRGTVVGWRFAFECKRKEFWRTDIRRPAFIVPSSKLYSLASLKNWDSSPSVSGGR